MERFLGFTTIIATYILFAYLFYKAWELLFEEASETVTKHMKVVCIILGILFPITSLIIIPVTLFVAVNRLKKL